MRHGATQPKTLAYEMDVDFKFKKQIGVPYRHSQIVCRLFDTLQIGLKDIELCGGRFRLHLASTSLSRWYKSRMRSRTSHLERLGTIFENGTRTTAQDSITAIIFLMRLTVPVGQIFVEIGRAIFIELTRAIGDGEFRVGLRGKFTGSLKNSRSAMHLDKRLRQ